MMKNYLKKQFVKSLIGEKLTATCFSTIASILADWEVGFVFRTFLTNRKINLNLVPNPL